MRVITTPNGRRAPRRPRTHRLLRADRHPTTRSTSPAGRPPNRDEPQRANHRRNPGSRKVTRTRIRWVVSGQIALLSLIGSVPAARAEDAPASTLAQPPQPAGSLGTGGVRTWILDNLIPLLLLAVALLLLWLGGGKGDNAGIMKRLAGVLVALAIVGLAVTTDAGKNIGVWLAGLFAG
jgi:hypothetical protein